MTQISQKFYAALDDVFNAVDLTDEEKVKFGDEFEKMLMAKYAVAMVEKLPEQERKGVVELANAATTEEQKKTLKEKVAPWFADKELENLFKKTADSLFEDLLKKTYRAATDEQKKKLEEMFKKEVLRV